MSPPLRTYSEILDFISQFRPSESVIPIDGPLIIPNLVGLRECERMIGRKYGSRYASCHANLTLYPGAASVRLTEHLETLGYRHPSDTSVELGSMIEVYPHAAFVAFFDLLRIIRYKKGRVAQKVSGLMVLQATLSYLASGPHLCCVLRHSIKFSASIRRDYAGRNGKSTRTALTRCSVLTWRATFGVGASSRRRSSATAALAI